MFAIKAPQTATIGSTNLKHTPYLLPFSTMAVTRKNNTIRSLSKNVCSQRKRTNVQRQAFVNIECQQKTKQNYSIMYLSTMAEARKQNKIIALSVCQQWL